MQIAITIKRVTTTFLVKGGSTAGSRAKKETARDALRIAIFHRCSTMPTFPDRYAACSGSIEFGETPWETALRELQEETNYTSKCRAPSTSLEAGLYVDVDFVSPRSGKSSIIRVYPFVMHVLDDYELTLKGTEHDDFQWMSVEEVEELDNQCKTVPSLALAFHHATAGRYCSEVTNAERQWASDKENGKLNVPIP